MHAFANEGSDCGSHGGVFFLGGSGSHVIVLSLLNLSFSYHEVNIAIELRP